MHGTMGSVESMDSRDVMDAMVSTDSMDCMDSMESVESLDSTEFGVSVETMDHSNQTNPLSEVQPPRRQHVLCFDYTGTTRSANPNDHT